MMNNLIVFDRYDIPESLKSATRHLWLGDSHPVAYHILVKRIAGILKREQIVYHCMAK